MPALASDPIRLGTPNPMRRAPVAGHERAQSDVASGGSLAAFVASMALFRTVSAPKRERQPKDSVSPIY